MLLGPFTPYVALGAVLAIGASGFYGHHLGVSHERTRNEAELGKATQALHEQYVSEMERGNVLASALAEEQQRNNILRGQHARDARLIAGTCPSGLRVLFNATASGTELSEAARKSLGAPGTITAFEIGDAISENHGIARDCQAQLNKLIDWHEGK